MMTDSTAIPPTFLERVVGRLSRPRTVALLLAILLLLRLGLGYLSGNLAQQLSGRGWLGTLLHPVLFVYLLIAHRVVQRFIIRAIDAFRSLVTVSRDEFDATLAESRSRNASREWLALGVGTLAGLILFQPWRAPVHIGLPNPEPRSNVQRAAPGSGPATNTQQPKLPPAPASQQQQDLQQTTEGGPAAAANPNPDQPARQPLRPASPQDTSGLVTLYRALNLTLASALLGWILYRTLALTRLFSRLHRLPLNIDIFDPTPLEPVARMSLSISLALIGVATLPLILTQDPQTLLNPRAILVNGTVILVAVIVFFLTMTDTHRVMLEAKEKKLDRIRHSLSEIYDKLEDQTAAGEFHDMEALSDSLTAWLTYKEEVEKAPEWPYTTDTLRNLLMSTLLPIFAWGAQMIVELFT